MDALLTVFLWGDEGWGDEIFFGAVVTLEAAFTSYVLGLLIGLCAAAAKLSKRRPLQAVAHAFSVVFRGLPELLIISIIYFGGGLALRYLLRPFGFTGFIEFNPYASGALALGLVTGAYATEQIRGAILAVPKGQVEAATALALTPRQVFFLVVLPQAWRLALPGLGNLWMAVLKNTALLSVIGVVDLNRAAYLGAASTRSPLPFFIAVSVCYMVITWFSTVILDWMEARANRGLRSSVH